MYKGENLCLMLVHYVPRCILHRAFEYCFIVLNTSMAFCDIDDNDDDDEEKRKTKGRSIERKDLSFEAGSVVSDKNKRSLFRSPLPPHHSLGEGRANNGSSSCCVLMPFVCRQRHIRRSFKLAYCI
jgi:hypothetical protein